MAMNMDAAIRISANVQGANAVQAFSRDLKGLNGAAKLSGAELGRMNIAINRMAREAGNTTAGLRQHLNALQSLRDRVEIGGKAYNRLGIEIDQLRGKLRALDSEAKRTDVAGGIGGLGAAGGALAALAAGAGGLAVGQQAVQAGIQREESTRRLAALSAAFGEVTQAQDAASRAAERFGLSQTEANQSFAQIYARLRPIGISLAEIETAFNGFNTAARLSGASTQEASNAWLQLSQALGSGVLRGEELNSIFEQTPSIVQAIALEMNAPIGQVRKLAEDGKITSDIVIKALRNIATQGAGQLEDAMKGPAQQIRNLQNAFQDLQVEAADTVLPAVIEATKALTAALKGSTLFLQDFKDGFNQLAIAAAPIADVISNITGAVDGLVGSFARLGVSEGFNMLLNIGTLGVPRIAGQVADIGARRRERGATDYVSRFANARDTAFAAARQIGERPRAITSVAATAARTGRARATTNGDAERAAKLAAANAEKTRTSGIELRNARELYDIEGRILEARLEDNQQLILARNAQKELLSIRQQAAAIMADKELPAAARKNALDKLAVQSGAVSRQLAFDLAELENKRALTAQEAINKLADERELLQAQLMGTEAEIILKQRLRELTKGMTADEKARAEALVRGNEALRQQKEAADEMKRLYSDIGMSIKDGVVGAIQGAIDGTKSLQKVASNLLQSIANKLLDVAINMALFGTMSGTGTGGGLLGFLFKKQAKGGAWENGIQAFARGGIVNKPTLLPLAGEAGPEAIMPLKRLPSGRLGVEAAGGGSGGSVNVVVNVDAKGSRVEGDQQQGAALGRAISTAVQAELVKQQRPGGLLAGAR